MPKKTKRSARLLSAEIRARARRDARQTQPRRLNGDYGGHMTAFPAPTMIKTNGIDMAVYEAGPKDGVPVVLCHGFPELAYSWRHQIAGARRRGLSRASRPTSAAMAAPRGRTTVEDYDMAHLTGDLAGMLDALRHQEGGLRRPRLGRPRRLADAALSAHARARRHRRQHAVPCARRRSIRSWACARCSARTCTSSTSRSPASPTPCSRKDVGKTFRFFMRKGGVKAADFAKLPQEQRNLALVQALAGRRKQLARASRC